MSLDQINIIIAASIASIIHSLIPTHWLPFVLAARAHRWNIGKTLLVTGVAGFFHVLSTIFLGVAIAFIGKNIISEQSVDAVTAAILIILGLILIILHIVGKGRHHCKTVISEKVTFASLILLLILSPCEAVIPLFIPVALKGDIMFILALSLSLIILTVGCMLILVALSLRGVSTLSDRFHFLEHYEKLIIGSMLCIIGIIIALPLILK